DNRAGVGQSGNFNLPGDVGVLFDIPTGRRRLAISHAGSVRAAKRRPVLREGRRRKTTGVNYRREKTNLHFVSFFKTNSPPVFFQVRLVTLPPSTLKINVTPAALSTSKMCWPVGIKALSKPSVVARPSLPSLTVNLNSKRSFLKTPSYIFSVSGST